MSLDCETCDALLIDLVERELDEAKSAEVRAHASTCESCARSLARLEGGRRAARELVRVEAPRLDAVMAAARARAAEVRAAAAAEQTRGEVIEAPSVPAPAKKEEDSWLEGALRWLGSLATRPQAAMAALLVLMVGIGVFNLPQFRAHEGGDADGALVEPDVRAELGPSALAPADRLDLDVDTRTQRVALGGSAVGTAVVAHDERPTTTIAQAEAPHEQALQERSVTRALEAQGMAESEPAGVEQLAAVDLGAGSAVGRVEDGPLPDVAASPEQAAVVLAPTTPPPVMASPSPTAARSAGTTTSRDEVEPPSTSPAGIMPAAIHRQARGLASAGHCDEAVPRYRALLTDHPDYADAPRAMIELAECDRRLGRLDDADHWLVRAETFPSVAADARRARVQITAARRAADHAPVLAPAYDTSSAY